MVVLEVLESLSLKPKQTPKAPSNNSTATNSTDDTLTSAKIATPVPSVNNSAEVTVVVVVVVEEDSECEALHTEVEDMDLEEGTNVEDLAVVEEDTDVVGMGEEDMVVVEGEDMGVVAGGVYGGGDGGYVGSGGMGGGGGGGGREPHPPNDFTDNASAGGEPS